MNNDYQINMNTYYKTYVNITESNVKLFIIISIILFNRCNSNIHNNK